MPQDSPHRVGVFNQGEEPQPPAAAGITDRHRTAGPVSRRTLQDWFRDAEEVAGVPHLKERGAYGLRGVAVDAANDTGISPHG